ncbi:amidohydrolase [Aspergillus clavatus NRRL 1]|uniref:Amidohydrolase family protein n=1 Tax=Aspergillus clavatus (strain ATCC 1007 / CBS 513.65 / DSM 816 / NCTC 3887 / NRRL 1 / QM 1276 / 107) TaxID=344612 RepID=A1C707_ASPCL|nr:amidohydrolase family protein [Aspergillus clavatus NRRL 1]EAW14178.1 amidohydrolase family protein [Aspergillus clavatus NRRL 1]
MKTIFTNGLIVRGSGKAQSEPVSCCMIVEDDKIAYIGDEHDEAIALAKQESDVETVDLEQRTVIPGFIDGHMHLLLFGASLSKIDLSHCRNLADIRATIQQAAQERPHAQRLFCRGWMHSMTDGQALASMLDDLDPRPIFIDSKDLHSAWCNRAALAELQVADTPDPAGGTIHRDAAGAPSGLLSEAAAVNLVWPHVAAVASAEEKREFVRAAVRAYNAAGYTGVVEMAMDENAWSTLLELRAREPLPLRIAAHWIITPAATVDACLAQVDRAIALHAVHNARTSPDFRIAGIKVICDGVVDACTAALLQPYASGASEAGAEAGAGVNCAPLWPAEMLRAVVARADAAGLQCALHAIGDATVRLAIDTLEAVGTRGRRHRIEHLELTAADDAARLGALGITASVQPVHADPAILRAWPRLLGEERCARAFAYAEFVRPKEATTQAQGQGQRQAQPPPPPAPLAIGTDAPTAPHLPLRNLYTATTRRSAREPASLETVNPHFRLSLLEAVTAATAGSAYSCFADGFTGSLEAGKKADFAVVDMAWEAERLLDASVYATYFDGRRVYSR